MKTSKSTIPGKAGKAPLQLGPHIREWVGDWSSRYWIQIGLTKRQLKALTRLGKVWSHSSDPGGTAAAVLILLGLLHQDDAKSKLRSVLNYIKAEGFTTLESYCDDVIRAKARVQRRST